MALETSLNRFGIAHMCPLLYLEQTLGLIHEQDAVALLLMAGNGTGNQLKPVWHCLYVNNTVPGADPWPDTRAG